MGQYHLIINETKAQFLHPHKFGTGLKLVEFGGGLLMPGLTLLLAEDDGRGGGDFHDQTGLAGSWSGDTIRIVGDYGDDNFSHLNEEGQEEDCNHYQVASESFTDISLKVVDALLTAADWYVQNFGKSVWTCSVYEKCAAEFIQLVEKFKLNEHFDESLRRSYEDLKSRQGGVV